MEPNAAQGNANLHVATLGGGCFWCLEAVFSELRGVVRLESGYSGGSQPDPSYREVCTGATGHAEVVQVTYDPSVISDRELLEVFFGIHDPTTLNRQGADIGTQYRSVIFYHTPEQKQVAEEMLEELATAKRWPSPIVTELAPFSAFYTAGEYHRDYYRRNSSQPYCRAVIDPKVAKFRKQFEAKLTL